jgi:hypothetical protein
MLVCRSVESWAFRGMDRAMDGVLLGLWKNYKFCGVDQTRRPAVSGWVDFFMCSCDSDACRACCTCTKRGFLCNYQSQMQLQRGIIDILFLANAVWHSLCSYMPRFRLATVSRCH